MGEDRRPNVAGQPIEPEVEHEEDPQQTRATRAVRQQGAANRALRQRRDRVAEEEGGVGYTGEGKDVDRIQRVEED